MALVTAGIMKTERFSTVLKRVVVSTSPLRTPCAAEILLSDSGDLEGVTYSIPREICVGT
jgi:hypothetical protein